MKALLTEEEYAAARESTLTAFYTPPVVIRAMYQALEEKGYNPINQIVGYILSEDPTYITNHNNARTLIRKVDRDELLQILLRRYLGL